MRKEHEIVRQVYAAKEDKEMANDLLDKYLPFIKAEVMKYTNKNTLEGQDDELSIAMFAFYEAILAYEKTKGAFIPFAGRAIRNRLIDYSRKEHRHSYTVSLDASIGAEEDYSLLDKLSNEQEDVEEHFESSVAREEILKFTEELLSFGLSMSDIADNCPKQDRTRLACHSVLAFALENPEVFDVLLRTKKLPLRKLAEGTGVEIKTLERHRKYIVAILLAYTNGFEIIKGHLKQITPRKGGRAS